MCAALKSTASFWTEVVHLLFDVCETPIFNLKKMFLSQLKGKKLKIPSKYTHISRPLNNVILGSGGTSACKNPHFPRQVKATLHVHLSDFEAPLYSGDKRYPTFTKLVRVCGGPLLRSTIVQSTL